MNSFGDVKYVIRADLDQVTRDLNQAEGKIKSSFANIGSAAKVVGGAFAALGVASFLKDSIVAFGEQERALNKLRVATDNQGIAWKKASAEVLSLTSSLQSKTGIADELQIDALQRLTTLSKDYAKSVKALPIVLDVAAATGRGLSEVADAVGRALGGNVRVLSQLVPEFAGLEDSVKKNIDVIGLLANAYSGQAEAAADGMLGSVSKLSAAFGDLKEIIGGIIARPLAPYLASVAGVLKTVNEGLTTADDFQPKKEIIDAIKREEKLRKQLAFLNDPASERFGAKYLNTEKANVLRELTDLYSKLKWVSEFRLAPVKIDVTPDAKAVTNKSVSVVQAVQDFYGGLKSPAQPKMFGFNSGGLADRAEREANMLALNRQQAENRRKFDELAYWGDRAARELEESFADFLFDPFKRGIDGMLQGFLDILRRMAAEFVAQQIFKFALSSLGFGAAPLPASPANPIPTPTTTNSVGGGGIRIVNAFNDDHISDFLNSASGERVILNVVSRNRSALVGA